MESPAEITAAVDTQPVDQIEKKVRISEDIGDARDSDGAKCMAESDEDDDD